MTVYCCHCNPCIFCSLFRNVEIFENFPKQCPFSRLKSIPHGSSPYTLFFFFVYPCWKECTTIVCHIQGVLLQFFCTVVWLVDCCQLRKSTSKFGPSMVVVWFRLSYSRYCLETSVKECFVCLSLFYLITEVIDWATAMTASQARCHISQHVLCDIPKDTWEEN